MLKTTYLIILSFCVNIGYAQTNFVKTGMPSSYCQTGYAETLGNIYVPLTLSNEDNSDFYSVIDVYDWQGQKLDSIEINPTQNKFYSVQALKAVGDTIFTCGLKGSCDDQSDYFIGQYFSSTSTYVELTSIKNSTNSDAVKGMFDAGLNKVGFYTSEDVFIYDFNLDSTYHVMSNLIETSYVSNFNEGILISSGSGLFNLKSQNLFNVDTVVKDQIRLMTIDQADNQVYIASNFFVIRLNENLIIQDTLHLVNGPMNIAAPNHMYSDANRLFMLDGNRVYTTDSNFNFVANDFSIGLRNSDTYVKNFVVKDNLVLVFGAKGNYFYSKSSHPWFLGVYGLNNSLPLNFDFKLVKVGVDSLYKFKNNGKDYFKARFDYYLLNNSSSISLTDFRANIYFDGKLCAGKSSQHFHFGLNHMSGSIQEYHSGWKTFGPIDDIDDYISNNTRFNISLEAFNQTDYGSSSFLHLATNPYGFIGIEEVLTDVSLSPNPTDGIISVSGITKTIDAILINGIGQTLWKGKLSEEHSNLDISSYPQGTYYLHLSSKAQHATKKIIKL